MNPSLSEKVAFFRQLEAPCSDEEEDDALGLGEETARQQSRKFFMATPPTAAPLRKPHAQPLATEQDRIITPTRRVVSAPVLPRASGRASEGKIIKGTPAGAAASKGRVAAMLDSTTVGETPIPDTVRAAAHAALRRSDTTPLPPMKRLLGRARDASPSAGAVGAKKRRRDAGTTPRPEEEQIFRGLAFFYVPDNGIAPARRLRINKAREYGAAWTRAVASATHVVVEKSIGYKDVEGIVARGGGRCALKVVNEDYPIDCIQFRAVLDHNQKRYQLVDQPTVEVEEAAIAPPRSSDESTRSLKLKPPRRNSKKWDFVQPPGTPSRSEELSQRSRVAGSPVLVDSQPISLDLGQVEEAGQRVLLDKREVPAFETQGAVVISEETSENAGYGTADLETDELSEYISMMQKYKDLPLDNEEDDIHPTAEEVGAQSDTTERSDYGEERLRWRKYSRKGSRSGPSGLAFEDRFACNQAAAKDANSGNPNARTIEVLQDMADYYSRVNDHWRTTGYRKAIHTLKQQDAKINTEEEAFRLPSIGRRLAQKIEEIVTTNKLQRLEFAQGESMDETLQLFLGIYGVGNKQAQQWIAQGFRTLDELRDKANPTANQLIGIDHYDDLNSRIPRCEVEALGAIVKKTAAHIDPAVQLIIGGSYRRGAESSSDIDLIVTKPNTATPGDLRPFMDELVQRLQADDFLVARLASSITSVDGSKWHGCCVLPPTQGIDIEAGDYRATWRRIDFLLVPEPEMGAALIYFTGNDIFNRSMRLLASRKGMRLNQRGLYKDVMRGPGRSKLTEGQLLEGRDERRIFEILGVKWLEPHARWC